MSAPRTALREAAEETRLAPTRWVVIPTYNEALNIRPLIGRILALGEEYRVLIVDDSSPDGTGGIVADIARSEPRVRLLSRAGKQGLASAYVQGFSAALDLGADTVFQMDADFSHDPADLPRLAEALGSADVVIGSRYVRGASMPGWPPVRRLPSAAMNLLARVLLGSPVKDVTGGFKVWRREVLETLRLDETKPAGFAFQVEMNYRAWRADFRLAEVPVTFSQREHGKSKISARIALEMLATVLRLSADRVAGFIARLSAGIRPRSKSARRTRSSR